GGTQAVQEGGLPAGAVAGAVETFLADGDHRGVGDESGAAVVAEVDADDDGGVGGHQAAPRAGSASRSHSPVFPARSRCRAPSWQSWTVPPRWANGSVKGWPEDSSPPSASYTGRNRGSNSGRD